MLKVGPPYQWIPNNRGSKILFLFHGWLNPRMQIPGIERVDCILIEKTLQFTPVLCKGQLYLLYQPYKETNELRESGRGEYKFH